MELLRIKKVFNNNIVLVEDARQMEMILQGRGLAFGKKAGDFINPANAEKRFVIDSPELTQKFSELMSQIPPNHLELSWKIIEDAQQELGVTFSESIFVGLTDHINYALQRFKQNLPLKNHLLWETRRFYPKEFAAAQNAVKTINYYENICLPEDEAGFIALHFVNAAQSGVSMETTLLITQIVQEILKIVQVHFGVILDEKSLDYQRLVTHVRYFAYRLAAKELIESDDDTLFEQVRAAYPDYYACVCKIVSYFGEKFQVKITREEQMYLMLHIGRVITRQRQAKAEKSGETKE